MTKLALFVKSYSGDLERCVNLSQSILDHNKDNLPFYVSVPREEVKLFEERLPHYTQVIADDEVTRHTSKGWVGQQYVKAYYFHLELSEYYLVIDSDGYFIKDFYEKDFFYDEVTPFMVMHTNEELLEWVDRFGPELFTFDFRESYTKEYTMMREFFDGVVGKVYHYGGGPFMWNTKVWKRLDEDFGIPYLFNKAPNELKWYGEAALFYQQDGGEIDFMPTGPFFKGMAFAQQYQFYKQLGWTEEHWKVHHMGIVMQSNQNLPVRY